MHTLVRCARQLGIGPRVTDVEVLAITGATVRRGDRLLLDRVDFRVQAHERWVVLGPNGAGKTTLMQIASTRLIPTSGSVAVLGHAVGGVDIAELRPLIGWASAAMAGDIPPAEAARDVVLTGAWSVTGRWRERYEQVDEARADGLMRAWGIDSLARRTFGTLSEGERKRTLIARALMADPELLLLDEPGAGLDLGGREDLVSRLSILARDPSAPAQVVVTHHVEEIPPGFTHALLLRAGRLVAAGPIAQVVTTESLSATFDQPIALTIVGERMTAQRAE